MGRPSDWSVAGLPGDPIPGDPAVIKALAVSWGSLADDAEWAKNRVNALLADGAVMDWIGKAGDAFRAHSGDLPGQLDKASRSYRSAASALSVWSADLEGCQGTADKGLALAHQAQDDVVAAQRVLATARANETSARNASKTLSDTATKYKDQPPPSGVLLPDPSQVAAAAQRATAANNAVTTAQHTVEDAQTRLTAAKKLIGDAGHLRDDRANVAAASINAAANEGIPPDSFWDDVGDVLSDVWHGIVEIAKIAVLVLGVIALIIGGPIAWVLLAAALVVLADTLIQYAQGKASLLDVGLALLSCIPMTKGLTTLAELGAAFKTGGALGAGAHLLSSAKTMLVEMARGIRAAAGGLRTIVTDMRNGATLSKLAGDAGFLRIGDGSPRDLYTQLRDPVIHPDNAGIAPKDYDVTGGFDNLEDFTNQYLKPSPNPKYDVDWDWPPNRGAVQGTETMRPLSGGETLDRIGGDGGSFFSPKDTPFGERALPPDRLNYSRNSYAVDGAHPDVMSGLIQARDSQIAPWFGQKGGGLQTEFINTGTGNVLSVSDLKAMGIIK